MYNASHYSNSGSLLTNYSTSGIAHNTRQKRAPEECPREVQRKKKAKDKNKTKQDRRR